MVFKGVFKKAYNSILASPSNFTFSTFTSLKDEIPTLVSPNTFKLVSLSFSELNADGPIFIRVVGIFKVSWVNSIPLNAASSILVVLPKSRLFILEFKNAIFKMFAEPSIFISPISVDANEFIPIWVLPFIVNFL